MHSKLFQRSLYLSQGAPSKEVGLETGINYLIFQHLFQGVDLIPDGMLLNQLTETLLGLARCAR
jgi:hypothetical protein